MRVGDIACDKIALIKKMKNAHPQLFSPLLRAGEGGEKCNAFFGGRGENVNEK